MARHGTIITGGAHPVDVAPGRGGTTVHAPAQSIAVHCR